MEITVNGKPLLLPDGKSGLADVLEVIGIEVSRTGIAVALNYEIVPRQEWSSATLQPGDEVEIVTARQGG